MGYASAGAGIAGGTLGGIGDIVQAATHKKLKFPGASKQEQRLRRFTMQDLANARGQVYGGAELYNQTLPFQMGAIPGYSASVESDPAASAEYEKLAGGARERESLLMQRAGAKAGVRGAKGKAAKTAARGKLKGVKQQLRAAPNLDALRRGLYGLQATPAHLKFTKNDPTQTDVNAQNIQDELSNRTLAALRGETPNPTLEHNLTREQAQMQEQMMHQLGPDWQNSSAGIEAMNQFNQYANDQRDMSNRHDIEQMYQEQLGGQQAQYGFAGAQQRLLGAPSMGELQFAKGMAGIGDEATQAQSPYQFDRTGQYNAAGANWGYGNPYGHALQQSGDRWISAAGAMGGGGGGGQMPAAGGGGQ